MLAPKDKTRTLAMSKLIRGEGKKVGSTNSSPRVESSLTMRPHWKMERKLVIPLTAVFMACGGGGSHPPDAGAGGADTTNLTFIDGGGINQWIIGGAYSGSFQNLSEAVQLFQGTVQWSLSGTNDLTDDPVDISVFVNFDVSPVEGTTYNFSNVSAANITIHKKQSTLGGSWVADNSPTAGSMSLDFTHVVDMPAYSHGTLQAILKANAANLASERGDVALTLVF
jgi:hypothetical protein